MNLPKSKKEIISEKKKEVLEFLIWLKEKKQYNLKELHYIISWEDKTVSYYHLWYFMKQWINYYISEEALDFLLKRKQEILNNTK